VGVAPEQVHPVGAGGDEHVRRRAALALVAAGAAPYGIVYATDATAEARVTVVGTFPEDSHPPIVYPAAAIGAQPTPAASSFLAYLGGPEARAAFERQGFGVPDD